MKAKSYYYLFKDKLTPDLLNLFWLKEMKKIITDLIRMQKMLKSSLEQLANYCLAISKFFPNHYFFPSLFNNNTNTLSLISTQTFFNIF